MKLLERLANPVMGTATVVAGHSAARRAAGEWLAAVIFVLLVVPAGPNHVLVPMLAITVAAGFLMGHAASMDQLAIRSTILAFGFAGLVLTFHGFVRSTPGWDDVAIPLVGGPIAWFMIAQLANREFAVRVIDIVAVATITISLMIYALNFKIGDGIVRWIEPGAFGVRSLGRSRTNFVGITTLIATVPMLASTVIDRLVSGVRVPNVRLHAAALAFCAPAVVLSGRQALVGTIALLPVMLLARHAMGLAFDPARLPTVGRLRPQVIPILGAILVVGALITMAVLDVSPVRLLEDALASVGIGNDASSRVVYSAEVRERQSESLLREFGDRPVLGHGAGAVAPDYFTWRGFAIGSEFRFTPRPWRAELSYQLLLFEGGLVGAALYAGAAAAATVAVLRTYRRCDLVAQAVLRATVVGALAILVGAAFDPHLRAVGAQVLLFLPVIVAAAMPLTPAVARR